MPKLLLIDGNAILHRAYHAYPPTFSDKDGNPTNAIYGFYAMLLKVLEEQKPDYLTICFDRGEPTFRMNMYAGYHANRPKMSDDLSPQVPRLHSSLDVIGIPHFGIEGYEADDLIGTLAKQATEINTNIQYPISNKPEKLETVILTGDRDLLQLINPYVTILMPITGITKSVVMDEKSVEEKYGVKPSQFIDYKALVGDQSDGYPGVSGIGPKTAAGLLQQFGSLENLYAHLADIKPEVAQKLATDAEQCGLAKQLATIHTDAPVHLDLEKAKMENFEPEKFMEVFEEFNIHSLVKRLVGAFETKETKGTNETEETKEEKENSSLVRSNDKKSDQLELL